MRNVLWLATGAGLGIVFFNFFSKHSLPETANQDRAEN